MRLTLSTEILSIISSNKNFLEIQNGLLKDFSSKIFESRNHRQYTPDPEYSGKILSAEFSFYNLSDSELDLLVLCCYYWKRSNSEIVQALSYWLWETYQLSDQSYFSNIVKNYTLRNWSDLTNEGLFAYFAMRRMFNINEIFGSITINNQIGLMLKLRVKKTFGYVPPKVFRRGHTDKSSCPSKTELDLKVIHEEESKDIYLQEEIERILEQKSQALQEALSIITNLICHYKEDIVEYAETKKQYIERVTKLDARKNQVDKPHS